MIPAALRQVHPPLQVPTQRLLLVNASTVAVPDPLQPRRLPTLPSNRVRVVLLRQVRKDHFTLVAALGTHDPVFTTYTTTGAQGLPFLSAPSFFRYPSPPIFTFILLWSGLLTALAAFGNFLFSVHSFV
jgi:hypothetical protein